MAAEAFAASKDYSSLLLQLLQLGGKPADDVLAWLQSTQWKQMLAEQQTAAGNDEQADGEGED